MVNSYNYNHLQLDLCSNRMDNKYLVSQNLLKYYFVQDEYWAPEACAMEKYYLKEEVLEEEEKFEIENFTNMIEIWTAVNLYVNADYKLVSDLSETQLRYIFIANQMNCQHFLFNQ